MPTVSKKELIDTISDKTVTLRVAVKAVVQQLLDEIIIELSKNNRIEFRDFGVFEVIRHAPRIAQNPKTLKKVHVPAKRTVRFKEGRLVKEKLNTKHVKY
jgi:integration host factor subunit beta